MAFNNYKYPKSVISFLKRNSIFLLIFLSNNIFQSFFFPKLKNLIFFKVLDEKADS